MRAAWRLGSGRCPSYACFGYGPRRGCELCGGTGTFVGPVPTGDAPSWIANPAGDHDKEPANTLVERRVDLEVLGLGNDSADYEYDEAAVVRLDGKLYLLTTSGCSCPDPCETWGALGPFDTLDSLAGGGQALYNASQQAIDEARRTLAAEVQS